MYGTVLTKLVTGRCSILPIVEVIRYKFIHQFRQTFNNLVCNGTYLVPEPSTIYLRYKLLQLGHGYRYQFLYYFLRYLKLCTYLWNQYYRTSVTDTQRYQYLGTYLWYILCGSGSSDFLVM